MLLRHLDIKINEHLVDFLAGEHLSEQYRKASSLFLFEYPLKYEQSNRCVQSLLTQIFFSRLNSERKSLAHSSRLHGRRLQALG